jgi:hypothetical protein
MMTLDGGPIRPDTLTACRCGATGQMGRAYTMGGHGIVPARF